MDINIPTEIGKSNELPSFLILAGAKFIKIFLLGNSIWEFLIADSILFLDSLTLISGNPTISNSGIPFLISVWTSTKFPSNPVNDIDFIFDNIFSSMIFKIFIAFFYHLL